MKRKRAVLRHILCHTSRGEIVDEKLKSTILQGQKAIADYYGRNWITIMGLIKKHQFPAVKINGRWEADAALIIKWRRQKIKEGMEI